MHLRRSIQSTCALALTVLTLTACGGGKTFDEVAVKATRPVAAEVVLPRPLVAQPIQAATIALTFQRYANEKLLADTVIWQEAAARRPAPPLRAAASVGPAVPLAAGDHCGGIDYPPCYVSDRESGGSYSAFNPSGCGGNGCYGRWQFSGAWAGKLGLPSDLSTATPEQQDEAAKQLWSGGSGCGNWAAC